jgi:trypsin
LERERIVGGTTTTIAEWPWQVAVTADPDDFTGSAFDRQFCGGTLVAARIVVTAAHCTFDIFDSNNAFDSASNFASITGATNLSTTSGPSAEGQELSWTNLFVFTDGSGNPLYDPANSRWDVVFARLEANSTSTPVKIAGANEAGSWAPAEENAWATGWGRTTEGGSKSTVLREVNLDMLADSTCGAAYGPPGATGGFHPDVMVCAGEVAGGQDTCQGDSGGPLVAELGPAFRLVGDTSFGFGCARAGFPGVYGRVAQDPICSALRNGIQAQVGVDAVGSGGCLAASSPPPPPPPPTDGGGGAGDTAPPNGQITKGPKDKTKQKTATFEFSADEAATFNCVLDGQQQFKPCTSPLTVKVKKGKHTFSVTATDSAGNADLTPATDSWKVKKRRRR